MPARTPVTKKSLTAISKAITLPKIFPRQKSTIEKVADTLTGFFGTLSFLFLNFLFFVGWIIWNLGLHPDAKPFDPYPFGMLTMIVSLEAIMLSIVVLISQNRANKASDSREQIDYEVDITAQRQITEILKTLDTILHHLKIKHEFDQDSLKVFDVDGRRRKINDEIDTD